MKKLAWPIEVEKSSFAQEIQLDLLDDVVCTKRPRINNIKYSNDFENHGISSLSMTSNKNIEQSEDSWMLEKLN